MSLASPLGLVALSSLGIVVLIHLYQRRFRRRRITGLFLWREGMKHSSSGRTRQPPPPTLSLLLELLACCVLSLLLAGARCSDHRTALHAVLVLDGSASMGAIASDGTRFTDRAAQQIRALLEEEEARSVTVVVSGATPRLLYGPQGDIADLATALREWRPEDYGHAVLPAVNVARTVAAGTVGPVFVVSDKLPESCPAGLRWVAVGEPLPNVGFMAATRTRRDDGNDLIRLSLRAFGPVKDVRLVLREGEQLFDERTLSLQDGAVQDGADLAFTLPTGTGTIEAELPDDALAIDNRVYLPPPPSKKVRCLNQHTGRARQLLDRALSSIEEADLVEAPPADLYLGPGSAVLEAPTDAWVCAFAPYAAGDVAADATVLLGPYTVDARHPLMEGVSLRGVAWSAPDGLPPASPSTAVPIVSCGTRSLLVRAPAPHRGFLFNGDLARGNIGRTRAWPLILYNLIGLCRTTLPGPDRTVYSAGDILALRLPPLQTAKIIFRGDAWEKSVDYREEVYIELPKRPMPIKIGTEEATLYAVGVNWHDPTESDLQHLESGTCEGSAAEARAVETYDRWTDPIFWFLLAVLAACLFLNWWITQRGGGAS